jgi:hypothetical protein
MPSTCDSYLQGLVIRATRLTDCGVPDYGPCGTAVSDGFINIELENQETDPQEISQVKANGERCYYYETPKLLNNVTANIELCEVDPEMFEMLTGAPLVLDDDDTAHGFTTDSASYGVANVALELWMNLAGNACTPGEEYPRRWGYYLMPWLYQGTVGKPTVENGAVNFTISEAKTRDGNQWGVGPYNIQRASGVGRPLSPLFTPISSTTHDLLYKVNVAPPEPTCGCTTLVELS